VTEAMDEKATPSKWTILAVVMSGTFMAILNISVVNVALPHVMTSLRTDVQTVAWVVTGFMLAAAVCMPATGWLGTRFGFENMYIFSLMVFTLGSALCSAAWDLPSLILFRVVQALGGGIMQPTGMALMVQHFPLEERGRALGIWGIGAMMAPTLGPTTGGYLTDWLGWRSVFWVNVPVGIVCTSMALQLMGGRKPGPKPPPFDWQGYIALAVFLLSTLLGLDRGRTEGWHSGIVLLAWAVAAVALTTFIVSELTVKHPVFPLGLLRHRDFVVGLYIALVRAVSLFGTVFLLPMFMQKVQWHDAIQTGLVLMPGAVMTALTMPTAGFLTDRIGARVPGTIGVIVTAYSFYLYHQLDLDSSAWDIIWLQVPRGVGIGFMMAPFTTAAMNAVERQNAGTASALLNVFMQAGGSFGIAVLATVLERRTIWHLERLSALADGAGHTLSVLRETALSLGYGGGPAMEAARGTVLSLVQKSAQTRAFGDVFVVAGFLTLLGLPAALALSRKVAKKPGQAVSPPGRVP